MKIWSKKILITSIGILLGVLLGYTYWYFWGCTETCTITSSPINSSLYGACMGGLAIQLFTTNNK